MANSRRYAPAVLTVVVAGALVCLGWMTLDRASQATCSVCGRAVHLTSRVDGVAEGEALTFCCAACALRAKEQSVPALRATRLFVGDGTPALLSHLAYDGLRREVSAL